MSAEVARAFIERLASDAAFAAELEQFKTDPPALLGRARSEGFDVTETEVRDAVLERYGASMSADQLDGVAAGFGCFGGDFGWSVLFGESGG